MHPSRTRPRVTAAFAVASVCAAAYAVWVLVAGLRGPLAFDDAYMFYRYALHVREGLGLSWNMDGVHTYGETSLLWGFTILLLSYLPLVMNKMLVLGSWLCWAASFVAMAWSVAHNAHSKALSRTLRVLPFVLVPLAFPTMLSRNAITGMESMLALLLVSLFTGLALGAAQGRNGPWLTGLAAWLAFEARPEATLVVVLMIGVLFAASRSPDARRTQGTVLALFAAGICLHLFVCRMYFGTPVPLSFYMKGRHAYMGYVGKWSPTMSTFRYLLTASPYLLTLLVLPTRAVRVAVAACLAPAAAVVLYLATVTQIMGLFARYYVPYLPLAVIPALLALDAYVAGEEPASWPVLRRRILSAPVAAFVLVLLAFTVVPKSVSRVVDRRLQHQGSGYDPVAFDTAGGQTAPEQAWFATISALAEDVVKPLPAGSTIAASEVGFLGAEAPRVNVIDIAGLNDTGIALHGFHMDALLARKPDLIWFPHDDYTYQRGIMFSDPALLEQYDVYAGAANYGLAVRKDSPLRQQIHVGLDTLWKQLYPGTTPEQDRVVKVRWPMKPGLADR